MKKVFNNLSFPLYFALKILFREKIEKNFH